MRSLWALCLCLLLPDAARGCTVIAIGRKASADGSVILAHTDDAGGGASDLRLIRVPAADHKHGDKRPVYATDKGYPRFVSHDRGPMYAPKAGEKVTKPIGRVPQVKHTYSYYEHNYGLVNEVGLALAESSVSSRTIGWSTNFPYGYNMFDINELSKVALERCATARCAIRTMGALAEKYGFYSNYSGKPSDPKYADSAEALAIGDATGEVWIFHMLTGAGNRSAIWAAQRVPDDSVVVVPNTLVIREMDLTDEDNFMASRSAQEVAKANDWWDPAKGPFDFAAAYVVSDPIPLVPVYTGRRMWRIYDLLAPSLKLDPYWGYMAIPGRPTYPFAVKPERPVEVRDVMRILRDHYEGTEFDLTQGLAAGPFNNPVRYSVGIQATRMHLPGGWERSIAVHRAIYSFVTSIRPKVPAPMAAIMWFGQDSPHGTVYIPFYGGQETVPQSYVEGKQSEFSLKSAYWVFNLVNVWSYNMWRLIHREVVAMQAKLEDEAFALKEELDQCIGHMSQRSLMKHVEQKQGQFVDYVVEEWWQFAWKLVAKYNNGYICTGEDYRGQWTWGYPVWWLKYVGYDQWPADTFEYPQNFTARFVQPTAAAAALPPTSAAPTAKPPSAAAPTASTVRLPTSATARQPAPEQLPPSHLLRQVLLLALGAAGAYATAHVRGTPKRG
eukprot:EG_transcript_3988